MSGPYSVTFYGGPLDGRTMSVTRLDQTVRVPVFDGEPTSYTDVLSISRPEITYHSYDLHGRSYVSSTDPPDWLRGPSRSALGGRVYIAPISRDSGWQGGWQEVGYIDDEGFSRSVTRDREPVFDFDPSDERCSFTVTLRATSEWVAAARETTERVAAALDGIPYEWAAPDTNSATVTRCCGDCEIYWTGGVHCWNCGQSGEISYGPPIQDQHGFPEIPW